MRSRLLRPEFWQDSRMARLPGMARLLYIGLWNLTDDAGFLEWDLPAIGAALFPYESPRKRERDLGLWSGLLVEEGRVSVLSCREHARIPTIERWKISGGKQFYGVRDAHSRCRSVSVRTDPDQSRSDSLSDSLSDSDSGSVRTDRDREGAAEAFRKVGESLRGAGRA